MFELMLVYVCKFDFVPKLKQMFDNFWLNVSVAFSFGIQLFAIYSPLMQEYLKTTPLNLTQWAMILLLASTAFLVQPLVVWSNNFHAKS